MSCNYLRNVKIVETASEQDYSCYQKLALSTNLLATKREQIACKPTITPIVDHQYTLLRADWRSISYLKASLTTARELDLIAVTGDLNRRFPTTMDAGCIACCSGDEFRPMVHSHVLTIDDE
jgi:hypothetical protein